MIEIKSIINDACVSCYQMHSTLEQLKANNPELKVSELVWDDALISLYDLKQKPLMLLFKDDKYVGAINQNLPLEILEIYLEQL